MGSQTELDAIKQLYLNWVGAENPTVRPPTRNANRSKVKVLERSSVQGGVGVSAEAIIAKQVAEVDERTKRLRALRLHKS